MSRFFLFLMIPRPPRSPRPDTRFPYPTLVRSTHDIQRVFDRHRTHRGREDVGGGVNGLFGGAIHRGLKSVDRSPGTQSTRQLGGLAQAFRGCDSYCLIGQETVLFAESKHGVARALRRSEEHTSELQSLMRISYAVFCLKKKRKNTSTQYATTT